MTLRNDSVLTLELRGRVALLGMKSPPVNALGFVLRSSLFEQLERLSNDPAVDAVVLFGHGKGFSAGGDIKEFGTPAALAGPGLSSDLQPLIENAAKPVIAAMHGFALGGGLETALACHYRVAAGDTKVGLPELGIGLIPLSGTQRLPRLVGLARAQQLILDAKPVRAADLADTALFDVLQIDGDAGSVLDAAVQLAGAAGLAVKKTSERRLEGSLAPFDAQGSAPSPAHRAAQRALVACAEGDFTRGMAAAKHAYESIYALNARDANARFENG